MLSEKAGKLTAQQKTSGNRGRSIQNQRQAVRTGTNPANPQRIGGGNVNASSQNAARGGAYGSTRGGAYGANQGQGQAQSQYINQGQGQNIGAGQIRGQNQGGY